MTPEKKCYICVEREQPFKISMFVEESYLDQTYGCNLYLDGKVSFDDLMILLLNYALDFSLTAFKIYPKFRL